MEALVSAGYAPAAVFMPIDGLQKQKLGRCRDLPLPEAGVVFRFCGSETGINNGREKGRPVKINANIRL
jgi:hypothetical protein